MTSGGPRPGAGRPKGPELIYHLIGLTKIQWVALDSRRKKMARGKFIAKKMKL